MSTDSSFLDLQSNAKCSASSSGSTSAFHRRIGGLESGGRLIVGLNRASKVS